MTKNWNAQGFWDVLNRCVQARMLTLAQVCEETGVSLNTLIRLKTGIRPDAASLSALCSWSGLNAAQFAINEPAVPIRFGARAMGDAIVAMVQAKVDGDETSYTAHETAMRKQLAALEHALWRANSETRVK